MLEVGNTSIFHHHTLVNTIPYLEVWLPVLTVGHQQPKAFFKSELKISLAVRNLEMTSI